MVVTCAICTPQGCEVCKGYSRTVDLPDRVTDRMHKKRTRYVFFPFYNMGDVVKPLVSYGNSSRLWIDQICRPCLATEEAAVGFTPGQRHELRSRLRTLKKVRRNCTYSIERVPFQLALVGERLISLAGRLILVLLGGISRRRQHRGLCPMNPSLPMPPVECSRAFQLGRGVPRPRLSPARGRENQ